MKRILTVLICSLVLQGCNFTSEVTAFNDNLQEPRIWAFIQFNVPEEGTKIDSYYYFAEVSEKLFDKIKTNSLNHGFIYLQDVRYWGQDDVIYQYRDNENHGDLVFRIEDIRVIKRVNSAPIIGKGIEQYDETEAEELSERAPANVLN